MANAMATTTSRRAESAWQLSRCSPQTHCGCGVSGVAGGQFVTGLVLTAHLSCRLSADSGSYLFGFVGC